MIAIDTNIIVRALALDNDQESRRAAALIQTNEVFVSLTVLLETEWVLRASYGFSKPRFASSIRGFAGLPGVSLQQPERVYQALGWLEAGMGFADALHLASSGECEAFVTFDQALARAAAKTSGSVPVRLPD